MLSRGLIIVSRPKAKKESVLFQEPINICIFGGRGQGKSLLSTYLIYKFMKRNPQTKVFDNGVLKPSLKNRNFLDIKKFVGGDFDTETYKNSIFFLDEVNVLADSRRTMTTFQQLFDNVMIMQRKLGISMIMTTQKPESLSRHLINQLDYEIFVEKKYLVPGDPNKFEIEWLLTAGSNNPALIKRWGRYGLISKARLKNPSSLYSLYDTSKAQDFLGIRSMDSDWVKSSNLQSEKEKVAHFIFNELYPRALNVQGNDFKVGGFVDEYCDWFSEIMDEQVDEKNMTKILRSLGLSIRKVNGARKFYLNKDVVHKKKETAKILGQAVS